MRILSILFILTIALVPLSHADTVFSGGCALKGVSVSSSGIEYEPVSDGFVGTSAQDDTATGGLMNAEDYGNRYTIEASESGQISYAHIYAGGSADIICVLYDSLGTTKLAETTVTTISGSASQRNLALQSSYTVTSGTSYVVVWGHTNLTGDVIIGRDTYTNASQRTSGWSVANPAPSSVGSGAVYSSDKQFTVWFDNSPTGV